jgi:hypothetical protein
MRSFKNPFRIAKNVSLRHQFVMQLFMHKFTLKLGARNFESYTKLGGNRQ